MRMILKALSGLLTYPQQELVAALPEIAKWIDNETRLSAVHRTVLSQLVGDLDRGDLLTSQEHYVELFDRGRSTCLHLFEHVHGESRDRGMAMIDLSTMYQKAGLVLCDNELPDYLPVVLEYLSTRSESEVCDMLGDCAHILRKVGEALLDRNSPYSGVFAALLALVREPGLVPTEQRRPFCDEKSIDDEWVEEPVVFGPGAKPACANAQGQTATIHFMPRPRQGSANHG